MNRHRLPLIGGSYSARSRIANCTRAVNVFPEVNPEEFSPVPMTHYPRPGLRSLVAPATAGVGRGLYTASDGSGYACIDNTIYSVSTSWVLTALGTITAGRTNLVSFIDNGTTMLIVDGSTGANAGWTVDLATQAFAQVNDPTGVFTGADRVDYSDTFLLWNFPGTAQFGSTLSNLVTFDPQYIGAKASYPDPLQTLIVNRTEVILLGSLKGEVWQNVGGQTLPFQRLPGATFEHGTGAKYSVACSDISTFWLAQSLKGNAYVVRLKGYEVKRISNYALEFALRKASQAGNLSDAIGYCYEQDGHWNYVLTLPSADQTWVFDDSMGENPNLAWHQRAWTDANGTLRRERPNCAAFMHGSNVALDWENGRLYEIDPRTFVDEVNGAESPTEITCIRTFPHILGSIGPDGTPQLANGKMIQFNQFFADIQCGDVPLNANGTNPQVTLRYSDDRGKTFTDVLVDMGAPGEYLTQPQEGQLGSARDRIFELTWSFPGETALNGAWVDARVLEQ
jgi:hypothetical protein